MLQIGQVQGGVVLGNAEKAVLLRGRHLDTQVIEPVNTWSQGSFWQQTLPLSVVSQIAGKVTNGLLWTEIKNIGPPRSLSLMRLVKNILIAQLAQRQESHSSTFGTWLIFRILPAVWKVCRAKCCALSADTLWHFAKGKMLFLMWLISFLDLQENCLFFFCYMPAPTFKGQSWFLETFWSQYRSAGVLSPIISSLHAATFPADKLLFTCKNTGELYKAGGLAKTSVSRLLMQIRNMSYLGGLLCLGQTHSVFTISSAETRLWQKHGVLFQQKLYLFILSHENIYLEPKCIFYCTLVKELAIRGKLLWIQCCK